MFNSNQNINDKNSGLIKNSQIHRIFVQKLQQKKMDRKKFLQSLKQLPQLLQSNNLKTSQPQVKCNLGVLHLYQIISLYQILNQQQLCQVPYNTKLIFQNLKINQQFSQSERVRLVIQQMIDAQNLYEKAYIQTKAPFTLLHHRPLSEILIKFRPNMFYVGKILFQDQNLTETLRVLYDLRIQEYQKLWGLNFIQDDTVKLQENQINLNEKQVQNQQNVQKIDLRQQKEDNFEFFEQFQEKDRKQIQNNDLIDESNSFNQQNFSQLDRIFQIQLKKNGQKILENLDQVKKSKDLLLTIQNDQHSSQSKDSIEKQVDFLKKQRTRLYMHSMSKKLEKGTRLFKQSKRVPYGWGRKCRTIAEQSYAQSRNIWIQRQKKRKQIQKRKMIQKQKIRGRK